MLGLSLIAFGQTAVPMLSGHVIDQTATLNVEQISTLEQTLQGFEAKKGSQIAVLIIPSVSPETIEQYTLRVAEKWKLGRKKVDDGAILVIAKNDRTLRIEVGYGLEGALNDATSKRIISEIISPRLTQGDFYGGVTAGLNQMMKVINGEPLPLPATEKSSITIGDIQPYAPVIFIVALILGGLLRTLFGRFPGAIITGAAIGGIAWLFVGVLSIALIAGTIALLFTLITGGTVGRNMIGLAAVYGRGGGSGGFSGGGGGFGGGGASGRW
ncbi:TPM domain-containing protein [Undibacterium sp. 5I1]|uniref:TPM domain-containing protein n=1 Tax=unclassified Undibacterium TaxID=2630295 RepID=UPI002AB5365C|nr:MULTISPECIES: TPM domain-containing protein [unclassified Undibacterium]MDY7537853.1 TPM domain-containing protein [Undibacterium sp. 5I1]MEB0232309.1 TPM domain-containing protein [Undibacterium sp. 10I3]MEB0259122.1 TPM domain-containing protein [Undibacterium sp. 5I1]